MKKELYLFVSEASHPVTAKTNSPRMVGNDFTINFDFGSWKQIIAVSTLVYFDASVIGSEYSLGQAQRMDRTDSFDDVYMTHIYKKAGRRRVRVDMTITLPVGKKFVQLLIPTIVADDIDTVVLLIKCISLCSLDSWYNISRVTSENVTATFPYQASMEISAKSDSLLTEWTWWWRNTHSRDESVRFLLTDYMEMRVTVSNAFSKMSFFVAIQYSVSMEDVILAVSDSVNQMVSTNIAVVFTSFDDLMKIRKSQAAQITLQITNREPGSLPINIVLPADKEVCYENSVKPLKDFLAASGRLSLANVRQGIYSYCERTIQQSFSNAGPHNAMAKIIHQVRPF